MSMKITSTNIKLIKLQDVVVGIGYKIVAEDDISGETTEFYSEIFDVKNMAIDVDINDFRDFKELRKNIKSLVTELLEDSVGLLTKVGTINPNVKVKYLERLEKGYSTIGKKEYYRFDLFTEEELKNVKVMVSLVNDKIGYVKPLEDFIKDFEGSVLYIVNDALNKLSTKGDI